MSRQVQLEAEVWSTLLTNHDFLFLQSLNIMIPAGHLVLIFRLFVT